MSVYQLGCLHVEFKSVTADSGPVAARSKAPSSPSITYYMLYSRCCERCIYFCFVLLYV